MNSKQYSVNSDQWTWLWLFVLVMIGCQAERGGEATAVPLPTTISTTEAVAATATAVLLPSNIPEPTTEPAVTTAANADVLNVQATLSSKDTWTFNVTVAHPDNGWDDYADGWDVVLPDGTAIRPDAGSPFTRILLHPHDTEQPFTRSQSGISIPADVTQVTVRAHDLVDGFGGEEVVVDLTAVSGPNFTVQR